MKHRSRTAIFSVCCVFLTSALGLAQEQEGVPIGRWVLYPSLDLEYSYSDNILFEPPEGEVVSDFLLIARPHFGIEMPFYQSFVRLSYSPEYQRYE